MLHDEMDEEPEVVTQPVMPMFSQSEIEQILKEDHEQFDICLVLNSHILEEDLKKEPDCRKVVTKIISAYGKYVKIYCEGYLSNENLLCIKLTGICEDSGITIIKEELEHSMILGICKVMIIHGVIPLHQPLKLIKSFTDFARICIFPFLTCIHEGSNMSETASHIEGYEEEANKDKPVPNLNSWNIELLGLPYGILEDEVTINFINNECAIALHYLSDETFRMTITSLEDEHIKTVSINLELEFDERAFEKTFEFYEHESFTSGGRMIGLLEGETMIRSLKVISKDFI